ncbi:hypothetical protein [Sporosalibacterium faouarense]|uniref:hypothetical protein n=1 Tax=Sporosalibacterium faouarense TaxID=516123 RepID=UPI00192AF780|nr:hypothetical protein [Sporosalibacterium faouarense]
MNEINELMTVSSSAKRFAFNRLIENKTKKGNPNLRIIIKNNMTFLEISTLNSGL